MRHLEETDAPIAAGGPLSTSYLFHFPPHETVLEGLARDELTIIADTLSAEGYPYQVIINGNAERGKEETVSLSLRRADYLRDALNKRGIKRSHITYNAFGEATNKVSPAGMQRVELFIE